MTLRGFSRAEGDAIRMAGLVGRVHHLLAVHAEAAGGTGCPSGTDVGLARFDEPVHALHAALALVGEVEAARDPVSHAHHGLLALGIDHGAVLVAPDGRVLGVPVARALRLAVLGEDRGELLITDAARRGLALPDGVGAHAGRREQADRLGFGFHHVVDYSRG